MQSKYEWKETRGTAVKLFLLGYMSRKKKHEMLLKYLENGGTHHAGMVASIEADSCVRSGENADGGGALWFLTPFSLDCCCDDERPHKPPIATLRLSMDSR